MIAAAAHARGLRVSGHIPSGMNAAQAVEAGYDEIQHVNFLFLRFLAGPGDDTRTPLRFTRVAERAAELDLDRPRGPGSSSICWSRTTPCSIRRSPRSTPCSSRSRRARSRARVRMRSACRRRSCAARRSGGLRRRPAASAPGSARRTRRCSAWSSARWDRKIPIVAGTDDIAGLSLPHELELYVQAGHPARPRCSRSPRSAPRASWPSTRTPARSRSASAPTSYSSTATRRTTSPRAQHRRRDVPRRRLRSGRAVRRVGMRPR